MKQLFVLLCVLLVSCAQGMDSVDSDWQEVEPNSTPTDRLHADYKKQLSECEKQLLQANEKITELIKSSKQLEAQNKELDTETEALSNQLETLKKEKEVLQQQLVTLQNEHSLLKSNYSELENVLKDKEQEINRLQAADLIVTGFHQNIPPQRISKFHQLKEAFHRFLRKCLPPFTTENNLLVMDSTKES